MPRADARRALLGISHRSRATFCRPVPKPNRSIRNLHTAVAQSKQPLPPSSRAAWEQPPLARVPDRSLSAPRLVRMQVEQLQRPLCGVSRPIFFRGVATVVAKLLNITEADVAVFGQKDYQQWRILTQVRRGRFSHRR